MRPLLAIDTSTHQAGLALFDGTGVAELHWPAGRTQTVSVLAQVHRLLELGGTAVADLGAVAVATGPGTFSGLRVGVSVAKGLVLALGVPILGVPTLAATAFPATKLGLSVVAVVPAGRGRVVWADYRPAAGATTATAARNTTVDDLVADLAARKERTFVAGETPPELEALLADRPPIVLAPPALRPRRPAAVAALAWERYAVGEADDPVALEPAYVGR